jgi:hypothetical protein
VDDAALADLAARVEGHVGEQVGASPISASRPTKQPASITRRRRSRRRLDRHVRADMGRWVDLRALVHHALGCMPAAAGTISSSDTKYCAARAK